jgi:hypothetical protein
MMMRYTTAGVLFVTTIIFVGTTTTAAAAAIEKKTPLRRSSARGLVSKYVQHECTSYYNSKFSILILSSCSFWFHSPNCIVFVLSLLFRFTRTIFYFHYILAGYAFRPPNTEYDVDQFNPEIWHNTCRDKGYLYFGFECPMTNDVHCQCYTKLPSLDVDVKSVFISSTKTT